MTVRDRQALRRIATAVIGAGLGTAVLFLILFSDDLDGRPSWLLPSLAGLVAVASAAVVRVRMRSTAVGTAWTDAAVLVCIVWLPAGWVPTLCWHRRTAREADQHGSPGEIGLQRRQGHIVGRSRRRRGGCPGRLGHGGHAAAQPWAVLLVGLTVAMTETSIGVPVEPVPRPLAGTASFAATATSKSRRFWASSPSPCSTLSLLQLDSRLLVVIPPLPYAYTCCTSRVHTREERAAWQRLAATTEELNSADLQAVVAAAVVNAARLFAADEVEVFLREGPDGPLSASRQC